MHIKAVRSILAAACAAGIFAGGSSVPVLAANTASTDAAACVPFDKIVCISRTYAPGYGPDIDKVDKLVDKHSEEPLKPAETIHPIEVVHETDEEATVSVPVVQADAVSSPAEISPEYMIQAGRISWGGYQWTYYSEKVLPGTGLAIPGRHAGDGGYVCDGDGYICLASDSLPKGMAVPTPFGAAGKIYDAGVGNAYTLDVYVDW